MPITPFSGGGGITALTGDVTASGTGTVPATLAKDTGETVYNSAQFDKTNSAVLSNVPGLLITLATGKTYEIAARVVVTPDAAGGWHIAFGGTAVIGDAEFLQQVLAVEAGDFSASSIARSSDASGATSAVVVVLLSGMLQVTTGGTLTITAAQATAAPAQTMSVAKLSCLRRSAAIA